MIRLKQNGNSNFEKRTTLAVVNRNFPQVKSIQKKPDKFNYSQKRHFKQDQNRG